MAASAQLETQKERASTRFLPALWAAILLGVGFAPTLRGIAGSWFDPNADMGHGLAVPLVAAFVAWTKQEEILRTPLVPNPWGLAVILWGTIQFTIATAADWVFATRISFLICLVGCLIALCGTRFVRVLAYPLGLLFMMITPPTALQAQLTLQLQMVASWLAERSLDLLGYSVLRDGNILEMVGERLAVAEACSGIRSLSALLFFCLAYNYFLVPKLGVRWLLLASVVPFAVLGNGVRIVFTGVIAQYNRELAHGMLHEAWGYVTVFIASALLIGLHLVALRVQRIRTAYA